MRALDLDQDAVAVGIWRGDSPAVLRRPKRDVRCPA